jgi:amidase
MTHTDGAALDATAVAELIRAGALSPREAVDGAIARIESLDGQLNAVVVRRFERARAEAAAPLPTGPFRGVPLVLKDLGARSAGDPYHAGTRVLRDLAYVADHDSYVTAKFRAAGFVIVGRTNVPELGTTITTESLVYGPCRNPWDTTRSPGGSSGGSAAATAARLVPLAHGTDGGGSIRVPASHCGLVGLKPSRGRISAGPDQGESWAGFSTAGVLTRTVRDTAAVLDVLAGGMPGDPYTAAPPVRRFADEVGRRPGRLRIGVLDHPLRTDAADPDGVVAANAAGELLASLGHVVETAWPDALGDAEVATHFTRIVAVHTAADLDAIRALAGRPLTAEDIEPMNRAFAALGAGTTAAGYVESLHAVHRWSRRVLEWWTPLDGRPGFDVLATPTVNGPPPPLGWLSDPQEGTPRLMAALQYTSQFNMTGQPAISLPLHRTAGGLPIGVQLVAASGREDVLLRLASQLEEAAPWDDRVPPVHA